MSKVTEKNTKAQILDAYEEAMRTIAELKAGKTTTAEVVKAKEVKAVKESAKQIVEMNILDAGIVAKYNNLLETIKMLEAEIEELYGIKKEADTLEALINAYKDDERKFKIAKEERLAKANEEYEEKVAANNKKIAELKDDYAKLLSDLKAKYQEEKVTLEKERVREKEEYTYNLNRERTIENDKWADEKAQREAALKAKEDAVAERESKVEELEQKIKDLESSKCFLETKIEEVKISSFEEGKAKAKKEADTSKVFSDRAHKAELDRKDDRIAALESALEEARQANKSLQSKLDESYARIQSMAIEAAKNSGVRMVESTNK